jgi:hypothetical protein
MPTPDFDPVRERREQWRRDIASAVMEWRALDAEEDLAIHAGAHLRAGRLSGLKTQVGLRLSDALARRGI